MIEKTYYIFNETTDKFLPDKTKFWNSINYKDVFHNEYLKTTDWIKVNKNSKIFGYSNDQRKSIIKNNLPDQYLSLFRKGDLYELLKGADYLPEFFTFNLDTLDYLEIFLKKCEKGSLWFLKKNSNISYGGYDVFPFLIRDNSIEFIRESIKISNSTSKKYFSDQFVIQKGINNNLLTPDQRKFDLRTYGLIVWEHDQFRFYYFKYMLMRKSMVKYDPTSEALNVQLTNTTQSTINKTDLYGITELIDDSYEWYNDIYYKTMKVYSDICTYIQKAASLIGIKGYHLIGLDFIPADDGKVYLLEINKHPAVYYDDYRLNGLHHGMEHKLFTESYFKTILEERNINNVPENFDMI